MSIQSRRELQARITDRYREADRAQKTVILAEFVAATGYARKSAIRLLSRPTPSRPPAGGAVSRPRIYGPPVQAALVIAWKAANGICGKRLVPFLPTLVEALERHGHLCLTPEIRQLLLTLSPATADRLLQPSRRADPERGLSTTRSGQLLKHQITVRTFADWNEGRPGFMEADLVAHCGGSVQGAYLHTFVLTDVATGWTECLPLLLRSQDEVLRALSLARQLLPFPLLGLDTDNGTEFLNAKLLDYCREEEITFTRGRPHRKNDQCFVEQKNGVIVRQMVGYDRYEGEHAYRQLMELYRALRLYVNFFQPSMKLKQKQRSGAKVTKHYDPAQTPYQRLCASEALLPPHTERLEALARGLDPVQLLQQLAVLQDAFWRHALPGGAERSELVSVQGLGLGEPTGREPAVVTPTVVAPDERRYRRSAQPRAPRTWRTREDPFAQVWSEVTERLAQEPDLTAKELFVGLQREQPGAFEPGQLRTLQRRVKEWRKAHLITFDAEWLAEEASRLERLNGIPDPETQVTPRLGALPFLPDAASCLASGATASLA